MNFQNCSDPFSDMALVDAIPTLLDGLRVVVTDFELDRIVIAQEMTEVSIRSVDELKQVASDVPLETMPPREFKHLAARDIRFPTSRTLDSSDAMNPDPDYSAVYVVLQSDSSAG